MKNYIQYRRDLHAMPEVGFHEEKTGAYIAEKLSKMDCLTERIVETGSFAFFDNGAGEAIAFRADIDALPIAEKTGLPFASTNGCMHACGHDAHIAMLLALADYVNEHKQEYKKDILLIFQPAEEVTECGGANPVCQTGILERFHVQKIFGLHVWPKVKAGAIHSRPGPLMAQCSNLKIIVHGKSAHCARPDLGNDALAALADLLAELNRYKREEIAPGTEYILHLGTIQGGDAGNIVCETAQAEGNVRAFESDLFEALCAKVTEAAAEVDKRYGTCTEVLFKPPYPTVINDAALFEEYQKALNAAGIELLEAQKSMVGEDFSYYQKRIPGVFAFLGLGEDVPSLHNNCFTFDEPLMETGINAFIALLDHFAR